jgi:hypothetical protein
MQKSSDSIEDRTASATADASSSRRAIAHGSASPLQIRETP